MGWRPGIDSVGVALLTTAAAEVTPTLSTDGRWSAYASNETGTYEVYVAPFPSTNDAKWRVSNGGGTEPLWSRGGGELFYRNGEGEFVAVRVRTDPTFATETTSALFDASGFMADGNARQYDVAPDDQRFIMLRPMPVACRAR